MNVARWDVELKKHWHQLSGAYGIPEFDEDPDLLISLIKRTMNSDAESTEFLLQDTLESVILKLNTCSPEQQTALTLEIFEKLANANDKKKTHSEVFTKPSGALGAITRAFRRDPRPFLRMDAKFCEVSYGTGNFIQTLVSFLMQSLRNPMAAEGARARAMSDQDLRTHILDHMIYGVELQGHFPALALFILDRDQRSTNLRRHLYQGDSLKFDFVFDGEPMRGQFDVVFGNPPYNTLESAQRDHYRYSREPWVDSRESGALHTFFIRLAQDLLRPGGMMLYVTRTAILTAAALASFRRQVLKRHFNILNIWIPQAGTLYEGAQTVGMSICAVLKEPGSPNQPTAFERYIEGQDHSCEYTIDDSDDIIPMLWHEHTKSIWLAYKDMENRLRTSKGGIASDANEPRGRYQAVAKILKNSVEHIKTNVASIRAKKDVSGLDRTDAKILVSNGCTDSNSERIKFLENHVVDSHGEYTYSNAVVGISLTDSQGMSWAADDVVSLLQHPATQIYASLIRVDRNTSAAFYRNFGYGMLKIELSKDVKDWIDQYR